MAGLNDNPVLLLSLSLSLALSLYLSIYLSILSYLTLSRSLSHIQYPKQIPIHFMAGLNDNLIPKNDAFKHYKVSMSLKDLKVYGP